MFNLGRKEDMGMAIAEPTPKTEKEPRVYYPSLYLHNIEGLDAPDVGTEGVAKIKFRIVSKSESERKKDDGSVNESKSVDIDIMGIEFDSNSEKEKSSDEDEIEKGLSESEGEMEEED